MVEAIELDSIQTLQWFSNNLLEKLSVILVFVLSERVLYLNLSFIPTFFSHATIWVHSPSEARATFSKITLNVAQVFPFTREFLAEKKAASTK